MSQDTFGRYTGVGRDYNELGSTTPQVELSESERPFFPGLPAPYLPATRFDDHKRANIVLSAGTPVALDSAGAMVPAGIPGGHAFTYSALDYTTGRVATRRADTGAAVAAASTYVMHSGLTAHAVGEFLRPIGIVSYNVYGHEGGGTYTGWPTYTLNYDNPVSYAVHNTMAQDLVAITCDYVILVPYVSGRNLLSDTVKMFDNSANEVDVLSSRAKSFVFAHDELIGTYTNLSGAHKVAFISPANGTGDNGVSGSGVLTGTAAALTYAATGSAAGAAVNITAEGWHILYTADPAKYVVIETEAGKTTGAGTGNITFAAATPIQPGDFVKCRIGKFVKYDPLVDSPDEIIGQALRVDKSVVGKSYMDKVKTAYDRATNPAHMMAGSATRGVPQALHLVTDGAWRQYITKKKLDGTDLNTSGMTVPPLGLLTINLLK